MQSNKTHAPANFRANKGFEYSFQAAKVLGALWAIVLLVVAVPSIGTAVVNARMITDLNMDRAVFGMGFGLFVMMMGFQAPVVAVLIRKFGYRSTVAFGCLVLFLGSVAMATVVHNGWQYAVAFGLLAGSGVCIAGMLPAQTIVTRWFHARRALAVSIVFSAVEIGGFFSPPALERLMAISGDWRTAWWLIAGSALIAMITAYVALDERRVENYISRNPAPSFTRENSKVFKSTTHWTLREALGTKAYWLILIYMSIAGVAWIFLMAHGVVHLRDIGYSPAEAANAVAVIIVASFIGNMTAGFLGDRISPSLISAASMALIVFGFCMVIKPVGLTGILLYALPAGIGYGASQVCLMALLGNYFGKASFSAILGSMMPVSTLCAAIGAGSAGAVFDQTGTYQWVFITIITLCVVAFFAILAASPPQNRGNKEEVSGSPIAAE
ncbi:MFS transporter [Agrobacterium vitis]|uniref:MFS transporter n=1 Tax=Agrobacterium vitis TaxID=373 RepID=UPI0015720ABE|nr:MFS transporter [Agrobacterium vitis]NSZ18620.1 MFS transporter [Agrobacterium vitis]QZO06510.1 MFS transporter [Agrobacterium vitis]UJL89962.1 MFS transporter [Agrobacterium vitis]